MHVRSLGIITLAFICSLSFAQDEEPAPVEAEPFTLTAPCGAVPAVDRYTSLVASFPEEGDPARPGEEGYQNLLADFARGMAPGQAYLSGWVADGADGGALELTENASMAHFRAGPNLSSRRGMIEMWVRSPEGTDLWAGGSEHWLFDARAQDRFHSRNVGLHLRADGTLALFDTPRLSPDPSRTLVYDPGDLDPSAWHHIAAGWDNVDGRLWLTVNGEGVTGSIEPSGVSLPFYVLFIGSSGHDMHWRQPMGMLLDSMRCSDVTPAERNLIQERTHPAVDLELLSQVEQALRRWHGFLGSVQHGGWGNCYTWPTMLSAPTGARQNVWPGNFVSNDKGHVGRTGTWAIYGSQVLDDPSMLAVGREMADAYLAAQMPQGCWAAKYYATPAGLEPFYPEIHKVKLQDQNQVHPMYILLYVYRLTGDQAYLEGAMRTGEFLIEAQNPNGSWGHSYDLEREVGITHHGDPHGGEINDLPSNDGMDAMLLMYHATGEQKYLDAFVRCADWFLEAQLGPPTYGWAFQYTPENEPAWARSHEPPSMCVQGTMLAYEALKQAYLVTGEERYIEAPRRALEWLQQVSPDEEYYFWYDHETGEPIAADKGKIYRINDPEDLATFKEISTKITYLRLRPANVSGALAEIDRLKAEGVPDDFATAPTEEEMADALPALAERMGELLPRQHESGAFISKGQGDRSRVGNVVWVKFTPLPAMLRYVEYSRTLLGEIPREYRGDMDPLRCAWPSRDWYDTPLREAGE
jgi:hypothetical protein